MTFLFSPKQQGGGKTESGQGDAINFRKWKRTFQQTFNLVYDFYILMFNSGKIVQKQSCQLIKLKLRFEGFVCYANEASWSTPTSLQKKN